MKTTTLLSKALLVFAFIFSTQLANAQWTTIATDPTGDGTNPARLDGTKLEFKYTPADDSLHFRISVAQISNAHAMNFGVNVMVNLNSGSKFNFWGSSNTTTWSKLISVWVTGNPPFSGTIGISDASGVSAQNYSNLSQNNISIVMDRAANTITLGLKRTDLITNADMGGNSSITVRAAAAVGASNGWNDDIYSLTANMTISNVVTTLNEVKTGEAKLYPNPTTNLVTVELPVGEQANKNVVITDIMGKQQTISVMPNGNVLTVNTENLANGIYWLTVANANGVNYREKLVILK